MLLRGQLAEHRLTAADAVRAAADRLFTRIVAETYDPETLADWGLPMVDPHPSESPHLVSEVVLRRDPPPPPAGVNATKVMANTFELREEVEAFVDLARIDVNSHWRWWHRPLSLLPPRKRWQLTR